MNREHIITGLFLIALGVCLLIWGGRHGLFFGVALAAFGALITFSGLNKP